MVGRHELAFSKYLIGKVEARLAVQTELVDRLRSNVSTTELEPEQNLFDVLKERLVALHAYHDGLLAEMENGSTLRD